MGSEGQIGGGVGRGRVGGGERGRLVSRSWLSKSVPCSGRLSAQQVSPFLSPSLPLSLSPSLPLSLSPSFLIPAFPLLCLLALQDRLQRL